MNSRHRSTDKLYHLTHAKRYCTHVLLLSQSWTTGHVHRTEPDSLPRERKRVYPMVYCTRSLRIHWLHAEHALILWRLRGKSSRLGRGRAKQRSLPRFYVFGLFCFVYLDFTYHAVGGTWAKMYTIINQRNYLFIVLRMLRFLSFFSRPKNGTWHRHQF